MHPNQVRSKSARHLRGYEFANHAVVNYEKRLTKFGFSISKDRGMMLHPDDVIYGKKYEKLLSHVEVQTINYLRSKIKEFKTIRTNHWDFIQVLKNMTDVKERTEQDMYEIRMKREYIYEFWRSEKEGRRTKYFNMQDCLADMQQEYTRIHADKDAEDRQMLVRMNDELRCSLREYLGNVEGDKFMTKFEAWL